MTDIQRRVLVTGVLGGIGRATSRAFRQDGWFVIGTDRRAVESAPGDGPAAADEFIRTDLSKPGAIDELVAHIGNGRLDALVNNAAFQANLPVHETPDAVFDEVLTTNLRAPFQLIREFTPHLRATRGAVVNVSSVHAVATSANVAAYAVSKGGLVALTRSTAIDLAPFGIRCNAVLPGAVRTTMLMDGLSRRPHPDGAEGNLAELGLRTPLGFVAEPETIAPTIVHLADGLRSPYTTGQAIVIDGGASIRLSTE